MKKVLKICIKSIFGLILTVIALVLLVLVTFNIAKFAIYSEYYSLNEKVCTNPGLNDGFVTQGVAAEVSKDLYMTSGYMSTGEPSRIYITNSKNDSKFVELYEDGEPYTGHAGGLALSNDIVYLVSDSKVFIIELNELLNSDKIDMTNKVAINNQASFAYADDEYLYVGEFHYGPYVCDHPYLENNAICSVYALSDLTKPIKIYSIPDKVQGFCVTDEGKIVLSTSWSVDHSYIKMYDEASLEVVDELDGVSVFYLGEAERIIKLPAMSEDLSYSDGKVYTAFESACNKYVFGKFFFAYSFVSLDI